MPKQVLLCPNCKLSMTHYSARTGETVRFRMLGGLILPMVQQRYIYRCMCGTSFIKYSKETINVKNLTPLPENEP